MLLNQERLHAVMADNGLDAIIATSPENVTYLSGYWALSQWIRRGPQTYVVWPAPGLGEPTIIASSSLLDLLVDQDVSVGKVETFGRFVVRQCRDAALTDSEQRQLGLAQQPAHDTARQALQNVLRGIGRNTGRIALDEVGLPPSLNAFDIGVAEDFEVVPGFEHLREVRAVKTEEEISRLAHVASAAEKSIEAALDIARPGLTEADLGRAFNLETIRHDAVPVLYCIGSGRRSAMPNVQPSDRKLRRGDIIRFDVGGRYRHYRADIARIAFLGTPSQKVAQYHHALWQGVQRGLELIKPGARACDIFQEMVEAVRRNGIRHYDRSHVGHGIGLDGYDLPNLTAESGDVLEAGMVLCVETPYYEVGFGGLQVEDMVVVREHGVQSLMRTSGKLIEIHNGGETNEFL
ncbi:MAG: aminopeptidase P family protein [Roseitalea sp.]|nr:aminopeptidase P family protein [Roseitalea sp.]MBO6721069.1 aminopeptidase P family protein [Roseitalea sp.]MBO6742859.1 aminopeptidase P family protein [Roseitalea sp.]